MTNQEIYNKLGDIGSITLIGVEMARADGEVKDEEIGAIANAFGRFASEDRRNQESFDSMIEDVMEVLNSFETFEQKKGYIESSLLHLTKKYDADIKAAMLEEISNIAYSDEELHENEAGLLRICEKYLG